MNEEEIIKYAENITTATYITATLQDKNGDIIEEGLVNKDVIQGLLNLYKQEKEKNKEAEKQGYIKGSNATHEIWKKTLTNLIKEIKDRPVEDMFITATQAKLNTIIELERLLEG